LGSFLYVFLPKIIALILVAALLLPILSACGRGSAVSIAAPILDIGEATTASRNFLPLSLATAGVSDTSTPHFADQNFPNEVLVPRDGYILAPTMFGLTGIDPLSSFFYARRQIIQAEIYFSTLPVGRAMLL